MVWAGVFRSGHWIRNSNTQILYLKIVNNINNLRIHIYKPLNQLDKLDVDEYQQHIDFISRIVSLETKLAVTIDRLDTLIDAVETKHRSLSALYEGDGGRPSLLSRIIAVEEFKKTICWSLGVLYTAVVGMLVTLLSRSL